MQERIRKLEDRVKVLEQEIERLRQLVGGTSDAASTASASSSGLAGDEKAVYEKAEKLTRYEDRVKILDVRRALDWEDTRFDEALNSLAARGRVVLHETDASQMSLSAIGDSFMGDNGEMFGELSLA